MDFNATVDLIIKDINEVREIIDDLKNYPGVPALQVELAKSKCKSAAEVIELLKDFKHRNDKVQSPSPADIKVKPGRSSKKVSDSAIIADTFSHLPNRLNEQLGSRKDDDDVPDLIRTKPIINLSEAIGVNDKFLFIRELFNGNTESYEKAISILDRAGSFADARAVIMNYAGNNMETEAVKQLLNLVKRKFPADE